MACEVNNKEINSQCAELLVRPTYIVCIVYEISTFISYVPQVLPTLPGWLPHNKDDGKAYHNTLLGR